VHISTVYGEIIFLKITVNFVKKLDFKHDTVSPNGTLDANSALFSLGIAASYRNLAKHGKPWQSGRDWWPTPITKVFFLAVVPES
ncbi:hypothetical protein, partial [Desulfobacter sp.]|uniref:hypothetical protein n=1 Tax=Desulfobacter sp. TaxID=2294 RepID=UPI003D0FCDCA